MRQAGAVEDTLTDFRAAVVDGVSSEDLAVVLRVIRRMQQNLEQMA